MAKQAAFSIGNNNTKENGYVFFQHLSIIFVVVVALIREGC